MESSKKDNKERIEDLEQKVTRLEQAIKYILNHPEDTRANLIVVDKILKGDYEGIRI